MAVIIKGIGIENVGIVTGEFRLVSILVANIVIWYWSIGSFIVRWGYGVEGIVRLAIIFLTGPARTSYNIHVFDSWYITVRELNPFL